MRLALAKLLLAHPTCWLLDEPDESSISRRGTGSEEYLNAYPQASFSYRMIASS